MPTRCSAALVRLASAFPAPTPTIPQSWTAPRWSARPARFSRRRCASSPTPIRLAPRNDISGLFGRLLQWRQLGQDNLDPRALAGLGIQIESAAQPIGDDAVDDMQAEAGAALIAPRREERIEGAAADIQAHAAAIVGK